MDERPKSGDCITYDPNRDQREGDGDRLSHLTLDEKSALSRLCWYGKHSALHPSDVDAAGAKLADALEAARVEIDRLKDKLDDISRVCCVPGCLSAVVRRDDGSRVCTSGHESRWIDPSALEYLRARLKALLVERIRQSILAGYNEFGGWTALVGPTILKSSDLGNEWEVFVRNLLQ